MAKSRKRTLSSPPKTSSAESSGRRRSKRLRGPTTGASRSVRSKKQSSPNVASKRATPKRTTPRKSKYFQGNDREDANTHIGSEDGSDPQSNDETSDTAGAETSGYEDEDESAAASSQSSSSSEDVYSSEEEKSKKSRRKRQGVPIRDSGSEKIKGKEMWRQGVKAGLGPGHQVFIERPKARPEGTVKYSPDKIHPNTMEFLKDLKANNDREWMKMHDADYRTSKNDWDAFVEALTQKVIEKDDTIPELPPKDLTFRIYRDIRFTPDPTPYKPYFSAAWSRTGRKGPYAGYYVQIQPNGGSFVGSGLWMPEAAPLSALRRDVDRRSHRIKQVLMDASIRKEIFGGVTRDEKKVVKAFVDQNQENVLKTKPKGYEAENANIELLRLRNYTMGRKLTDEEIRHPEAIEKISHLIGAMTPFVTYLNSVVMPDDASDSTETDDQD